LAQAERRALHDQLTQMWNRQGILTILEKELEAAHLSGTTLSIQIVDIDHFKAINDGCGHAAGDAVLRGVARQLRSSIRQSDAVGRLGGDEFLLIHPGADQPLAAKLAERGRKAVARQPIPLDATGVPQVTVTLSAGVETLDPSLPAKVHELLARADAALYCAKHAGRNRVEIGSAVAKGAAASGGQG
jgi:diguanylate cyclase (GGDEF)-like protein